MVLTKIGRDIRTEIALIGEASLALIPEGEVE